MPASNREGSRIVPKTMNRAWKNKHPTQLSRLYGIARPVWYRYEKDDNKVESRINLVAGCLKLNEKMSFKKKRRWSSGWGTVASGIPWLWSCSPLAFCRSIVAVSSFCRRSVVVLSYVAKQGPDCQTRLEG